ncbi:DUF1800 domain-containing protein [Pararoseomonas indoligenes]
MAGSTRDWLLAQLDAPPDPPQPLKGSEAEPKLDGLLAILSTSGGPSVPGEAPSLPRRQIPDAEVLAYLARLIVTPTPFRERLVAFWANHFTISLRGGRTVAVLAGDYVRTAIRPHVTGRFVDLLRAAVLHPAMLAYLNQAASVGPNSPVGLSRKVGLNENLAREILELHTLTPAAGYTQADVTEFARLLTGLTVQTRQEPRGTIFRAARHEPGTRTILGKTFVEGAASIDAAFEWLANHPSTQRHVALKLARHFVADEPPTPVVDRLARLLRATGGDLGAVTRELVALPEAWDRSLSKLRSPLDISIAWLRALGAGAEAAKTASDTSQALGQGVWNAVGPNGWPDKAEGWASPEGLLLRLDWAYDLAGRFSRTDARQALDVTLGPLASASTREAVLRAGSNREALTFLLGSPEFQRR